MFGRSALRRLSRETAVVHTSDGQSFRGVVIGVYSDSIVIAHARALLGEGASEELAGEVLIPLENISFIQRALP